MSASSPRRKAFEITEAEESHALKWERAAGRVGARGAGVRRKKSASVREGARGSGGRKKAATLAGKEMASATGREAEPKPVAYIIQNLERAYGVPTNRRAPRASDPLDMLVKIILSQATSDTNSDRTFAALKRRFPTWDRVLRAREETLAETIRAGGLANQKARVIRDVLRRIKDERGALDLQFLHDASVEDSVRFLSAFRGIGPKTVACTLLFACHKNVFPLDTHIFRVLRRVGLIPAKSSDARAHEIMNRLVPAGKFYSFHVNLIRHGRKLCRPRDPLCHQCPIVEYCDYGQERI
ncbi:MAG TPA: hypothetical protein VFX96_06380 [Pyrinomonadaceae bacterium]|nr:hypothetical protein [Pyrinomonadaceae bacterium]